MSTRVITTANLKGGTAKTTSSVFLAEGFQRKGYRVRLVDADPQGSSMGWEGVSVPTLALDKPTLHRHIWGVIDRDSVDVIVIDTPPLEEAQGIVASALRVATDVIVPMAPTMMELDRIGPVWAAIEDAAAHRDDDPNVMVLLNRTVANAASTEVIRGLLTNQGRTVLDAMIPRRELYAQAFGEPVPVEDRYSAVVDELITRWKKAEERTTDAD
jgi:chromosome partitioning protein